MRMLIRVIVFLTAVAMSASVSAINLQNYFPDSITVLLNKSNGESYSRYTFTSAPSGFQSLYDQFLSTGKPGHHYTWRKEYWKNGAWCTATYAILFMGDDLSVTEVGDWYASTPCAPNTVFGYKTAANVNAGLVWSPAGGLTATPVVAEMNTWAQATPGAAYAYNGYQAYSKTGVIEVLPTYTVPFGNADGTGWAAGNGRTFTNVVHIVMYHGTRSSSPVPIRCNVPPISANGAYYQSFKNYNSYGIDLYLAEGVGIIQEDTPFIEDGAYWGFANCNGTLFTAPYSFSSFIK